MLPYLIAGAIGYGIAKLFEDDKTPKYTDGGLIAPNGKPSNLTPEQYKLVRTKAFKDWFGDWENDPENASKVVDENGEPKVVGRMDYQRKYNYGKKYPLFFCEKEDVKYFGEFGEKETFGFLNIKNPIIIQYGQSWDNIPYDELIKAFNKKDLVNMINYEWNENYKNWDEYYNSIEESEPFLFSTDIISDYVKKESVNDGLIIYDIDETSNHEVNTNDYIVFNSNQIKLADGSNTTFDGNNPDIRFDGGGELLSNLIDKAIEIANKNEYLNCDAFCHRMVDNKLFKDEFQIIPFEMDFEKPFERQYNDLIKVIQAGDIIAFGEKDNIRHYAIYLGDDNVIEVEMWGGKPKIFSLKDNLYNYENVAFIYREKNNPDIRFDGGGKVNEMILFRGEGKKNKYISMTDLYGKGLYLTSNIDIAKYYGKNIKKYIVEGKIFDTKKEFNRNELRKLLSNLDLVTSSNIGSKLYKEIVEYNDGKLPFNTDIDYLSLIYSLDSRWEFVEMQNKILSEINTFSPQANTCTILNICLKNLGYVGLKYDSDEIDALEESNIKGDLYLIFDFNSVKLADGTNTTFDGNNPDIRFAEGGGVEMESLSKESLEVIDSNYNHIFGFYDLDWNKESERENFNQWLKDFYKKQFNKNLDKAIKNIESDIELIKKRKIVELKLKAFEELIIPTLGNEVLTPKLSKYEESVLMNPSATIESIEKGFQEAKNIIDEDGSLNKLKITPSNIFQDDYINLPNFEKFIQKNPEYTGVFNYWKKIFDEDFELSLKDTYAFRYPSLEQLEKLHSELISLKNKKTSEMRFNGGGQITKYKEFFENLQIEDGSKYIGMKFGDVFPYLDNKTSPSKFRTSIKEYNNLLSRLENDNYTTKGLKTADLNSLEKRKKYIDKTKYLSRFYLDPSGRIIGFDNSDNAYEDGGLDDIFTINTYSVISGSDDYTHEEYRGDDYDEALSIYEGIKPNDFVRPNGIGNHKQLTKFYRKYKFIGELEEGYEISDYTYDIDNEDYWEFIEEDYEDLFVDTVEAVNKVTDDYIDEIQTFINDEYVNDRFASSYMDIDVYADEEKENYLDKITIRVKDHSQNPANKTGSYNISFVIADANDTKHRWRSKDEYYFDSSDDIEDIKSEIITIIEQKIQEVKEDYD